MRCECVDWHVHTFSWNEGDVCDSRESSNFFSLSRRFCAASSRSCIHVSKLRGHKLSLESPILKLKHALGSSNTDLSYGVLKWPLSFKSKWSHFRGKTMDYKWVKLAKLAVCKNVELKMQSERVFSGLSDNHKIIQIGPTELKLWPL